jgi:hypothetical protein
MMIHRFTRHSLFLLILGASLGLTGCLYDYAPSGPVRGIDTWLLGQWATHDKEGHQFTATVIPAQSNQGEHSSDHYSVTFQRQGDETLSFEGWISRVDNFSILVLRSLDAGETYGKFALYHYEILSRSPALPGGIGDRRIRLSELQLDESTRTLDSYNLRVAIRKALKSGTLLVPYDVVATLKGAKSEVPGSVIWTKTGSVTIHGETF